MRYLIILWIVLIAVGLVGAITFSAFFFGFVTVGLFLILYNLVIKKPSQEPSSQSVVQPRTVATNICPYCEMHLDVEGNFCPRCGGKVRESE